MGGDRQRVNVGMHHTLHGIIYQPMAHDQSEALEAFRNDLHSEMAPAGCCAGVAGVQVGVVADFEYGRGQRVGQQHVDTFDSGLAHTISSGSSCMCFDSISVWMTTNAKNRPVAPNILKLTQAGVLPLKTTNAMNQFSTPMAVMKAIQA